MELKSAWKLLLFYSAIVIVSLYLYFHHGYIDLAIQNTLYWRSFIRLGRSEIIWQEPNATEPVPKRGVQEHTVEPKEVLGEEFTKTSNLFKVNKDEFGIPENEPLLLLRSAYLDYRLDPPKVWIIAVAGKIVERETSHCYYMSVGPDGQDLQSVNATVFVAKGKECFFLLLVYYCELNGTNPDYVTLTFNGKDPALWLKPKSVGKSTSQHGANGNIGACIKTLFDLQYDNIPNIIAFLEMQRLLGIQQVFLYDTVNSSSTYQDVFEYYENQGFLQIISWKMRDIHRVGPDTLRLKKTLPAKIIGGKTVPWCASMYGQVIFEFDCAFRNMEDFTYLAFHDEDELLIPKKHGNLLNLIEEFNENSTGVYSQYVFREEHFCPDLQNKNSNKFGATAKLNGSMIGHTKYIAKANLTIYPGVHYVKKSLKGRSKRVGISLGSCNHYRLPSYCGNLNETGTAGYLKKSSDGTIIDDFAAAKYFDALSKRMRIVANDLQGVLPQNVVTQIRNSTKHLVTEKKKK